MATKTIYPAGTRVEFNFGKYATVHRHSGHVAEIVTHWVKEVKAGDKGKTVMSPIIKTTRNYHWYRVRCLEPICGGVEFSAEQASDTSFSPTNMEPGAGIDYRCIGELKNGKRCNNNAIWSNLCDKHLHAS